MNTQKSQVNIVGREKDRLTVSLTGEIDHHSAREVREKLDFLIMLYRADTVVLELSGVSFMDSAGLGLLIGRYTKIEGYGGSLCVTGAPVSVRKIIKLAGADKLITVK